MRVSQTTRSCYNHHLVRELTKAKDLAKGEEKKYCKQYIVSFRIKVSGVYEIEGWGENIISCPPTLPRFNESMEHNEDLLYGIN